MFLIFLRAGLLAGLLSMSDSGSKSGREVVAASIAPELILGVAFVFVGLFLIFGWFLRFFHCVK